MPTLVEQYRGATGNIGGQIGNVVGGIGGSIFGGGAGSFVGGLIGRGLGSLVETGAGAAGRGIGGLFGNLFRNGSLANLFSNGQAGMPSGPGGFAGDPTDPNNPNNYSLSGSGVANSGPTMGQIPRTFQTPTALLSSSARNAMGLGTSGFAAGYGGSQFGGDQAYADYVASHTQK